MSNMRPLTYLCRVLQNTQQEKGATYGATRTPAACIFCGGKCDNLEAEAVTSETAEVAKEEAEVAAARGSKLPVKNLDGAFKIESWREIPGWTRRVKEQQK
jgi:hypothetical protein